MRMLTHLRTIRAEQEKAAQDHQRQLEHVQRTSEGNAERTRKRMEAEISDLKSNISKLEVDLSKVGQKIYSSLAVTNMPKANKNHLQDLQTAHDEYTANQKEQTARLQRAEEKAKEAEERSQSASKKATTAESALAEKEKEKQAIQSELDDLLMVFGDLEDKVNKYKDRLKELGESVSEAEDDDEDGEEDADDDDDTVD